MHLVILMESFSSSCYENDTLYVSNIFVLRSGLDKNIKANLKLIKYIYIDLFKIYVNFLFYVLT